MEVYTMGFTQKSASVFFEKIKKENIKCLVDIRLNNNSQLAGFTKGRDLAYFLREICQCTYYHEEKFAPTKLLLKGYKDGDISWADYEEIFAKLCQDRDMPKYFFDKYGKEEKVLLLCTEPTPECCHRRLVAEAIKAVNPDVNIHHI